MGNAQGLADFLADAAAAQPALRARFEAVAAAVALQLGALGPEERQRLLASRAFLSGAELP
jgi:hypothetical protein